MADDNSDSRTMGARIRTVRKHRRMTLKVLSARTGLSESFISQLERGLTEASIASTRRIADALGIMIGDLFSDTGADGPQVLRRDERSKFVFGDGATKYLLTRRPAHNIEVLQATIAVGGSTGLEPYRHGDSEELVVVLAGSIKLELGDEAHILEVGDSLFYHSSTPHRILNLGSTTCEILWVISPPSY